MTKARAKEKVKLIREILVSRQDAWETQLKRFIPGEPDAQATDVQIKFFEDESYYRLIRAGNRTGKTFSTCRDFAWKLCRTHPYQSKWNAPAFCRTNELEPLDIFDAYMQMPGKVFWILGPDYSFLDDTLWKMYLKQMIPSWYYTDEDGKENISYTQQGNISEICFRNGDVLQFKSYAQRILSLMGRKIDEILIDEMPPHIQTITELMMRLQDYGGSMTMGFTPLVTCDEVRLMLESHPQVRMHKWKIYDNPLYRDNPEKLRRFVEDLGSMPKNELDSRLNGEWYYELHDGFVFEGLEPIMVPAFEPPTFWRRVRVADPATHTTGYSEYAEDPDTGIWYCCMGLELHWVENVHPKLLVQTLESLKPHDYFNYYLSIYDNAESWFGASAPGWTGCIHKSRELAVMATRTAVGEGKIKFILGKSEALTGQLKAYRKRPDGTIIKRNDHILDTLMYFCRQIPVRDESLLQDHKRHDKELVDAALRSVAKKPTIPTDPRTRKLSPRARMAHGRQVR